MTGQGILLVGMMTEAVVTPFLSDRDLALQNVRYVMNAASGLTEDFHPAARRLHPDPGEAGASEAVDLLERIVHDSDAAGDPPLLAGHRGRHVRPDEATRERGGKGLDGVVERADGYDNPRHHGPRRGVPAGPAARHVEAAKEVEPLSGNIIRPYGDTTGDGMVQLSFTLPAPARQARRGGCPAARPEDGSRPGPDRAHQGDGPGLHLLRRLRKRPPPRQPRRRARRGARVPAPVGQGGECGDPKDAAPPARRRRGLHRHRRPHGRHRRDPQHQGLRRGEGPRVLPRDHGGQPRSPGARPGPRRPREGGEADAVLVSQVVTQKDAHIHNTTQMSAAFREAYPAGTVPILVAGGPRFEEGSEASLGHRSDLRPWTTPVGGRELPRPRDDRPERQAGHERASST